MGKGLKVARVFGIEVRVHPSWLIVFVIFAWSLATSLFPHAYPNWTRPTTWTVAVVATVLLFASVLLHELAHSLVARSQGIGVRSITLFLLGGVSTIEEDASSPGREALMAGAGPATSLVVGAVTLASARLVPWPETVGAVLAYLGSVNILLAVFNLLPGFPLDGGRVLRAVLWRLTGDFGRATRWAARTGNVFGYLFIAAGVMLAFSIDFIGGLWTGFVGWVLLQASQTTYLQSEVESRLEGVPVRALMGQPPGWVPDDITLRKAANEYFLALDTRCLPVEDGEGRLEGLVCLSDLQHAERARWGYDQVQDVMTPLTELHTIDPDEAATVAYRRLTREQVEQLAVMEDGRLVGFVDRTGLAHFLSLMKARPAPPPPPTDTAQGGA